MTKKLTIISEDTSPKEWYADGLRFKCTGCGGCCTGGPGFVWIGIAEIVEMAKFMEMSVDSFCQAYVRQIGDRYSLKETAKYDCVFLKENRCAIYPVRPTQCQTFPWWTTNLTSKAAWDEAANFCEGINHPDAPVVSYEEICKGRDS